jgi:hypothetical protein
MGSRRKHTGACQHSAITLDAPEPREVAGTIGLKMPESSSSGRPRARHDRMDAREALAREFWEVTQPEVVPFVSDEAAWYDFDWLEDDDVLALLEGHYGVAVGREKLRMPFWELLDFLSGSRSR